MDLNENITQDTLKDGWCGFIFGERTPKLPEYRKIRWITPEIFIYQS